MSKVARYTTIGYKTTYEPHLVIEEGETTEHYPGLALSVDGSPLTGEVRVVREKCRSTHGGAGYAPGSRREGNTVICGHCNRRVPYVEGKGL